MGIAFWSDDDRWDGLITPGITPTETSAKGVASGLCPEDSGRKSADSGHRPDATAFANDVLQRSPSGLGKSRMLHAVYSYFVEGGKSMKHAAFNEAWVKAGKG